MNGTYKVTKSQWKAYRQACGAAKSQYHKNLTNGMKWDVANGIYNAALVKAEEKLQPHIK